MSDEMGGGKLPVATLELPTPEELRAIREALERAKPQLDAGEEVTLEDLEKVAKELLAPVKE